MLFAILTFISFAIIYAMLFLFWLHIGIPLILALVDVFFVVAKVLVLLTMTQVRDHVATPYKQWKGERDERLAGIFNGQFTHISEDQLCLMN